MQRRRDLFVFSSLIAARCFSALFNIIHDCDEVYNYWEPLHRLLYGYGKQPWEYCPKYALRSYLYIILHWIVTKPLAWLFGNAQGKLVVFYTLRLMFAFLSGSASKKVPDIYWTFFVVLLFNAGLSMATTTFLPSSFAMFCLTATTTAMLERNKQVMIWCAVLGAVLGWPVCGVAFIPYAIHVLTQPRIGQSFLILFVSFVAILVPLTACDYYFYGRQTLSLVNFLRYNVVGGGHSSLYGVEPATYYAKNGFLNFNIILLLSYLLPLIVLLLFSRGSLWTKSKVDGKGSDDGTAVNLRQLILASSPVYVWMAVITALPHKEERFLYVVYPHICLSGSLCLVLIRRQLANWKSIRFLATYGSLLLYVGLSLMRIACIWINFRAAMQIFHHLPTTTATATDKIVVCTGDDWYWFPSAFFLPSSTYRLGFLRQRFSGLFPGDFVEEPFGTRVDQEFCNDRNIGDDFTYVDVSQCSFVFDFQTTEDTLQAIYDRDKKWSIIISLNMLDRLHSPLLFRIFYFPFLNEHRNTFRKYVLYQTSSSH